MDNSSSIYGFWVCREIHRTYTELMGNKSAGGDRMSDYEMIMIFLAILTLLYMAEKRNDK